MAWTIELTDAARKALKKIASEDAKRIEAFLDGKLATSSNPRQFGTALQGKEFDNLWRYRVGDYRLICEIQYGRLVILVVQLGHRREVYR